jgi:hypothetical protein
MARKMVALQGTSMDLCANCGQLNADRRAPEPHAFLRWAWAVPVGLTAQDQKGKVGYNCAQCRTQWVLIAGSGWKRLSELI